MLKRLTSVGACLAVCLGLALAQNKTYTVRAGDTLSAIAAKFDLSSTALAKANGMANRHRLSLGQKLFIPSVKKSASSSSTSKAGTGSYVVRNGDHDWALAKRFGVSMEQLHRLNPGVNWRALQIGQRLNVPGARSSSVAKKVSPSAPKPVVKSGGYSVRKNDNDWIIARKIGSTPSKLRALNPGVNWSRLQIGQKLNVPGSTAVASAKSPTIRSRHAVINTDGVTVRRGPSRTSGKIVLVSRSTPVKVLDHESGWYKLRFPRGTEGWVLGSYLKPVSAPTVASKRTKSSSTRVASKRSSGSGSHRSKQTLVAYNDSGSASGNSVLDKARSFRGVRYRYGGTSRSGFDCSGFTSTVYKANGVRLPRTSAAQAGVGKAVPKGQLKPGDLVFFRTRGGRRISHVGIYQGGGKFIHASSGGGRVQVNSLNDGYYSRRYAGARRVKNIKSTSKPEATKKVAKAEPKPAATSAAPAGTEHPTVPGTDEIIH